MSHPPPFELLLPLRTALRSTAQRHCAATLRSDTSQRRPAAAALRSGALLYCTTRVAVQHLLFQSLTLNPLPRFQIG
eukprot:4732166-Pleurochrysis_carterae.AAC.1